MSRCRSINELPLRSAAGPHRCIVCLAEISWGERYRDGGYPRRAHESCADLVARGRKRELTRDELRELESAEIAVSKAKGLVYQAERRLDVVKLRLLELRPVEIGR